MPTLIDIPNYNMQYNREFHEEDGQIVDFSDESRFEAEMAQMFSKCVRLWSRSINRCGLSIYLEAPLTSQDPDNSSSSDENCCDSETEDYDTHTNRPHATIWRRKVTPARTPDLDPIVTQRLHQKVLMKSGPYQRKLGWITLSGYVICLPSSQIIA